MNKKSVSMLLLSFFVLMTAFQVAKAAQITTATLDKDTSYLAGQTGYISVSIYNDKSDKIQVTELTATINYYYTDGTVYLQKFFANTASLGEIAAGQTETYQIPISLPTNIAPGYTNPTVEAKTEFWNEQAGEWRYSDHPTSQVKLYIESPYKQSYETSQTQLQEQKTANTNLNNTMNMLAVTTVAFASVAGFLMYLVFTRKRTPIAQP